MPARAARSASSWPPRTWRTTPKQAVTIFRQFATDTSVMASLGPTNSVGFVPVVPIAGQVKLPLIGDGSGAPIKEWNPYAYRVNPISGSAVPVMLKKVVAKLRHQALGGDLRPDPGRPGRRRAGVQEHGEEARLRDRRLRGVPRRRPGFLAADWRRSAAPSRTRSTSPARPATASASPRRSRRWASSSRC